MDTACCGVGAVLPNLPAWRIKTVVAVVLGADAHVLLVQPPVDRFADRGLSRVRVRPAALADPGFLVAAPERAQRPWPRTQIRWSRCRWAACSSPATIWQCLVAPHMSHPGGCRLARWSGRGRVSDLGELGPQPACADPRLIVGDVRTRLVATSTVTCSMPGSPAKSPSMLALHLPQEMSGAVSSIWPGSCACSDAGGGVRRRGTLAGGMEAAQPQRVSDDGDRAGGHGERGEHGRKIPAAASGTRSRL